MVYRSTMEDALRPAAGSALALRPMDSKAAAAILAIVEGQPQPPRAVTWRQALRVAWSIPGGLRQTLVAVPLVAVGVVMVEHLAAPPPPPAWLAIPALVVAGLVAAAAWELRTAMLALRAGPLERWNVDHVRTNYDAPVGYEGIGKARDATVVVKSADGASWGWTMGESSAERFSPGTSIVAMRIGKGRYALGAELGP